ncbi:uncharacterized protein LOC134769506 [Penaeus indicus]|uniref:uncharacterized protein LOC134769506 n=1 Tax=Penaeus indicus TaxID=29960 RepID=UPI00300D8354
MKFLVLVLLATAATGLPLKSLKSFPKKYDSEIDGPKSTYTVYNAAPAEQLTVPAEHAFLDVLQAPSSYDAYFEQEAQDPLLPPEGGSTYVGVPEAVAVDALLPPAVDTYSDPAGVPHGELLPPPVAAVIPADQSYVSYEDVGQVSLVPPAPYSYAHLPADASGADVLASLASMVQVLPSDSSYSSYEPVSAGEDSLLPTSLVPPAVESPAEPSSSSYSEVPEAQPELTQEEIRRAEEAQVPMPSRVLQPPPRT